MISGGVHGRKKEQIPPEVLLKLQEKDLKWVNEYKEKNFLFLNRKKECALDSATFSLTTDLINLNIEYYTVWNYRRKIFINDFKTMSVASKDEVCSGELKFVENCLKINPKSYWVWNQRRWILENMPNPTWAREIYLVDGFLKADARNFHGWNYRRYVISQSNLRTDVEEFDFTTKKIYENFSNHSAWHSRSVLLPKIFKNRNDLQDAIVKDLEIVRNAVYTDPDDQSSWLYQKFLLGTYQPRLKLKGCFILPEEKFSLLLVFNQPVISKGILSVKLIKNGISETVHGDLIPCFSAEFNYVATFIFQSSLNFIPQNFEVFVPYNNFERNTSIEEEGDFDYLKFLETDLISDTVVNDEVMFKEKKLSSLEKTVHFLPKHTHQPLEIWQNEMKYVKELIELEPESKWALLTLVNMLREVDQLEEMQKDPLHEKGQKLLETIEILEKLVKIDPSRKIFYMDTKSYILWLVHTISISISNTELNLTSHNLICIPSPQLSPANPRLSLLTTLNLENNSIGPNLFQNYRMHKLSKEKNSTTAFLFPVLKILNLKKNKLSSLRLLFQTFNFKNKITHFDCSFNVLEQESNLVEEFFYFFEKEQVDFKTLVEFNFQENLSIDWNKLVDKLNKFKFFHCKNLNLIY